MLWCLPFEVASFVLFHSWILHGWPGLGTIWICCVWCCGHVCNVLMLILSGWTFIFHIIIFLYIYCFFVCVFSVCLSSLNKFSEGAPVGIVTKCMCTCVCISVNIVLVCPKAFACCTNAKLLFQVHIDVPVFCPRTVLQVWHFTISWQDSSYELVLVYCMVTLFPTTAETRHSLSFASCSG